MKTLTALFGSAIAAIAILLCALILGGCSANSSQTTLDEQIPVVPTTLVYSIDAPGGFDRNAIAYSKPKSSKPETFRVEGRVQTITLDQAFLETEADTQDIFNIADLSLDDELGRGLLTDGHSTDISILKAVTCKSIQAHTPMDETNLFPAATSRIYCYTQVALPQGTSGLIQHIWRHEGVEQNRVDLFVQGPNYRTSSYKTIDPKQTGHWSVEVASENGEAMDAVEFIVE